MIRNLFNKSFNSGKYTSKSTIIKFKLDLRDFNWACLTFKKISFKINLLVTFQSDTDTFFFDIASVFCFSWVSSTIIANETHDDHVSEIRDACLAHFHLTWHLTWMTWHIEKNRFILHKLFFFKRLCEIDFITHWFLLQLLYLLLSIFGIVSHID